MFRNNHLRGGRKHRGFTLIEIMLVIVIIGVMVAVIIPRALRANVDTKYNLVRQAAAELGKWGVTWAERQVEIQTEADTCGLNDYVGTLVGFTGNSNTNWPVPTGGGSPVDPAGSCRGAANTIPNAVEEITPQDVVLRNPFNGVAYFSPVHDGSTATPGMLYLASVSSGSFSHYYFVFTGTDSNTATTWHSGMGSGTTLAIENARNGVFMARLQ